MAHASLIWLDISPSSIVIVCNECDFWRGVALNIDDAWERAHAHERLAHPGSVQVSNAISKRAKRARHAALTT